MKISADTKKGRIRIYINDILHLSLYNTELQIQSWKETKDWYVIVFYIKYGKIKAEYDDIEKWKEILKLIDEQ